MTSLFTTPWQDAGGFVHNASALHTTPPAQQKPPRWTFDLSYKADIFTRHRHGTVAPSSCSTVARTFLLDRSHAPRM